MSCSSNYNHTHTPTITKGNGNTQACAACKYQRRKCADCILAPYFPHDRQRQFLNAHKLFGVSNITKIIKHLDQPNKDEAMRTIIFQSDVRANDPVGGCYRIIRELQRLIEYNKAELDIVLHQLAICRAQAQQQQQQQQNQIQITEVSDNSCDQLINVDPLSMYNPPMAHYYLQPHHHALPAGQQEPEQEVPYVIVQNSNNNSPDSNNNSNPHQHLHEDVNMWAMQDSMSSLDIKHGGGMGEYLKPFVEIPCEDQRNGEVSFQPEDIDDHQQRFVVPNTELLISS